MFTWERLLCQQRIRDLLEFKLPSLRSDADLRNEFERDYARAIYSTPFRRLQDKAQVFPLDPSDAVRTRLTHSLEVSTLARDLASRAVREVVVKCLGSADESSLGTIPIVAATCGLVHDLGNPPFGHAGELAVREWIEKLLNNCPEIGTALSTEVSSLTADLRQFDGNAQGLRIVSTSRLLKDNLGLNFTAATLLSACKYIGSSEQTGQNGWHEFAKVGYFFSEKAVVDAARAAVGFGAFKHPIAFLVEAADDIAYCTSDIEDGVRKRVLYWPTVEQMMLDGKSGDEFANAIFGKIRTYISDERLDEQERNEAMGHAFRIYAVTELVGAAVRCFALRYEAIMKGEYHDELLADPECDAATFVNSAKMVLKSHLYKNPEVLKIEVYGRRVISDLLSLIWEALSTEGAQDKTARTYSGKVYNILSDNYRRTFERRIAANRERGLLQTPAQH